VNACVIDASVGIKLFLEEDMTDKADALFARLATDPLARFHVPDLFYIECGNILWRHCRRYGYPIDQAREALDDLRALALISIPTKALVAGSFDIAVRFGITTYDASYVSLAARLAVPLITADTKLVRALAKTPYQLHWLGDVPFPPT
jgi:predicted nucleic acid-binding protein